MSFLINPFRFAAAPPPASSIDTAVFTDAIWTWFNDARAITVSGRAVAAGVSALGHLYVFDSANPFTAVDLRGSQFDVDDHANPALLVRASDGKILAAACAHNGSGMYTYLSANPNDPSAFAAEVNIDAQLGGSDYSYATLVQLPGIVNDPIYLFFRNGDDNYYSVSTDGGVTWSARTQFLSGDGASPNWAPYFKAVRNGDSRIDFFCNDGNPEASTTNSLYHFYFDGTTFRATDGTALTLPILPSSALSKVYDGATYPSWVWDAAIDGLGNPVCVFHVQVSTSDYRYYRARWNGSTWDVNEIVAGGGDIGNAYYSGGVALDPDDVNTVFCSIGPTGSAAHRIWRYTTADGGSTWSGTQMTSNGHCFRPYVVRGAAEPRLLYINASSYASFTSYESDIVLQDSTALGNVIPDAFSFTSVTDAAASTVYAASAITVAGLGSGVTVPVRVAGGEYQKNGGAWTSAEGTATNGDTIGVRQTSAAANFTETLAELAVGGRAASFSVTTGLVSENPSFANVVYLPDFTGTDGATAAVDDSINAIGMTFGGNAQIDTANANYPSGALLLDGSGDYVDMSDNEAWNIGASAGGRYTIDVDFEFAALTNLGNTTGQKIIGQDGPLGNYSWCLWPRSNQLQFIWWTAANGSGANTVAPAWTPALTTKYRARIVSDGALVGLFLNGTRLTTLAYSAPANASGTCRIGARTTGTTNSNFNGWIGAVRVVKGEFLTDPNDLSYTPEALPFPRS